MEIGDKTPQNSSLKQRKSFSAESDCGCQAYLQTANMKYSPNTYTFISEENQARHFNIKIREM